MEERRSPTTEQVQEMIAAAGGGPSIATGSYVGNGSGNRQITTGFKCSMVVLLNVTDEGESNSWILIPNAITELGGIYDTDKFLFPHATDGFVVQYAGASQAYGNEDGDIYHYWAISE